MEQQGGMALEGLVLGCLLECCGPRLNVFRQAAAEHDLDGGGCGFGVRDQFAVGERAGQFQGPAGMGGGVMKVAGVTQRDRKVPLDSGSQAHVVLGLFERLAQLARDVAEALPVRI